MVGLLDSWSWCYSVAGSCKNSQLSSLVADSDPSGDFTISCKSNAAPENLTEIEIHGLYIKTPAPLTPLTVRAAGLNVERYSFYDHLAKNIFFCAPVSNKDFTMPILKCYLC